MNVEKPFQFHRIIIFQDARDPQGNTPLLLAIAEGNEPVYDYLLQPIVSSGQLIIFICNTKARNIYNHTAMHIATQKGKQFLLLHVVKLRS